MDLSLLPEEVLVNVLRLTSPTTVIAAKRLNKKLNRIVEQNHLGKPHVDDFSVEMRTFVSRTRPLGRLQLKNPCGKLHRRVVVTMKRKNKSKYIVQEGIEGPSNSGLNLIGEEMKKVNLDERLSFDGVTADIEFYNMLTAKWNDLRCVNSLSFTLCRLKLSEEQMLSLLTRTNCHSLTFDFCHFEHDIISDKVLSAIVSLQSLRVQPRSDVFLHQLTNATLRSWASSPPTTIALYSCVTNITLQGIYDMIMSLSDDSVVDWDFGRVLPSEGVHGQLFSMMSMSGMTILICDDFRSRRVQLARGDSRIAFNLVKEEAFTI
ncbi:F-box domain protein [Dictyocaulus viviparus]|uniref:F-box domain protein n=1 Tax=Dictyocaulus viviparus TaxID=29172 RepID=A0A0D8XCT5_DICVI|nr:F-box domain protein [Dictyocaulus viviparus]